MADDIQTYDPSTGGMARRAVPIVAIAAIIVLLVIAYFVFNRASAPVQQSTLPAVPQYNLTLHNPVISTDPASNPYLLNSSYIPNSFLRYSLSSMLFSLPVYWGPGADASYGSSLTNTTYQALYLNSTKNATDAKKLEQFLATLPSSTPYSVTAMVETMNSQQNANYLYLNLKSMYSMSNIQLPGSVQASFLKTNMALHTSLFQILFVSNNKVVIINETGPSNQSNATLLSISQNYYDALSR